MNISIYLSIFYIYKYLYDHLAGFGRWCYLNVLEESGMSLCKSTHCFWMKCGYKNKGVFFFFFLVGRELGGV